MNNDYYLQQILQEMESLENIIDNQEIIIQNQQTQISGDIEINNMLKETNNDLMAFNLLMLMFILYTFVKGCFRC